MLLIYALKFKNFHKESYYTKNRRTRLDGKTQSSVLIEPFTPMHRQLTSFGRITIILNGPLYPLSLWPNIFNVFLVYPPYISQAYC